MNCPYCGAALEEGTVFCTACGAKLPSEPEPVKAPEPAPAPAAAASVFCEQCGTPASADDRFCLNCGAPLPVITGVNSDAPQAAPTAAPAQPAPQPAPMAAPIPGAPNPAAPQFAEPAGGVRPNFGAAPASLKEYITNYADEKTRKNMRIYTIIVYVLAAINLAIALMNETLPLDAIILAGLAFWYQRTYSMTSVIILLGYSILSMVLSLLLTGSINGWLILVIAVALFTTTKKAQKDFEEFQRTGQPPMR